MIVTRRDLDVMILDLVLSEAAALIFAVLAVVLGSIGTTMLATAATLSAFVKMRSAVADRDAVIVGMDLTKGEEAVPITAEVDEGCLQRRFYPRDFREIDVSFDLLLGGSLEIEFIETVAVENDDPGLFRMRRIDKHAFCHGGRTPGHAAWPARMTGRSAFLSAAKLRRFRVLRRKASSSLPWRNSQGPRSGRFRILSFGVSYIRLVEASQKRNGDTPKGHPSPNSAATSPHGRWCDRLADCGVSRIQDTVRKRHLQRLPGHP